MFFSREVDLKIFEKANVHLITAQNGEARFSGCFAGLAR